MTTAPHIPVLLDPILSAIAPVSGIWLDGTFGAGGYTRALLDAGAERVIAIDRDPEVFTRAQAWVGQYGERLQLVEGEFGNLDQLAGDTPLDGVVLDIGVSSMQIDQAQRGFSFMQDGPLDMRMAKAGVTAADIVNTADEAVLADILFQYGEERSSRRIAKAIIRARSSALIATTAQLCAIIEEELPRSKPGQAHPATRSFQALRIAVNDELGQLLKGLSAAEAALKEGGILAVVTFHSLEDRIVKRFLHARSGAGPRGNRYAPEQEQDAPRFTLMGRKAITASKEELAANPRSRSAKLRLGRRTGAPAEQISGRGLGLPGFDIGRIG